MSAEGKRRWAARKRRSLGMREVPNRTGERVAVDVELLDRLIARDGRPEATVCRNAGLDPSYTYQLRRRRNTASVYALDNLACELGCHYTELLSARPDASAERKSVTR